jgi:phospholipid/cholesterol/gamma-HCH transport system substrate-binding protein
MPLVPSERYPVIRTVQSDFDLLVSSLPDLVTRGAEVTNRMSGVLSDANIEAVTVTLDNFRQASTELPRILNDVRQITGELERTVAEIEGAASGIRDITQGAGPDIKAAVAHARTVMEDFASTAARLEAFVVENQANITRFSDQGLLQLQELIRDSREAAQEFRELSRSLKREPSQLLYEPTYHGVEIPE